MDKEKVTEAVETPEELSLEEEYRDALKLYAGKAENPEMQNGALRLAIMKHNLKRKIRKVQKQIKELKKAEENRK